MVPISHRVDRILGSHLTEPFSGYECCVLGGLVAAADAPVASFGGDAGFGRGLVLYFHGHELGEFGIRACGRIDQHLMGMAAAFW